MGLQTHLPPGNLDVSLVSQLSAFACLDLKPAASHGDRIGGFEFEARALQHDGPAVWRLKVVAEADPAALVRVLHFFQVLNLVPRRVMMSRLGGDFLEIAIDIDSATCAPDAFRLIVGKVNELPTVVTAAAC